MFVYLWGQGGVAAPTMTCRIALLTFCGGKHVFHGRRYFCTHLNIFPPPGGFSRISFIVCRCLRTSSNRGKMRLLSQNTLVSMPTIFLPVRTWSRVNLSLSNPSSSWELTFSRNAWPGKFQNFFRLWLTQLFARVDNGGKVALIAANFLSTDPSAPVPPTPSPTWPTPSGARPPPCITWSPFTWTFKRQVQMLHKLVCDNCDFVYFFRNQQSKTTEKFMQDSPKQKASSKQKQQQQRLRNVK